MKLNKTLGRVATTLVAGAMLTALAMPAYADSYGTQGAKGSKLSSFKIHQTLVLPVDVDVPATNFTFDIVPVKTGTLGNITTDTGMDKTYDVMYGIGDTLNDAGSASLAGTETPASTELVPGAMAVTVDATFNTLPTGFTEPGIYKYQIDEDAVGTNYVDHTQALDLYVIVERGDFDNNPENADTCEVTGVIVYPANEVPSDQSKKTDTYVNYYRLGEDGKDTVGDITVKKTVTGAMGSKSEMFQFTVDGLTAGTDYTYYIDNVKQENTLNTTSNTFSIHDGQTVKITGIEDNKVLTITESDGKTNIGYSLNKVTVNNVDWNESNQTEDKDGVEITVDKDIDQNTVFTNNRDAVSPTGIVMNVAPYVLLVVVAAAGCFVFLRKRRED